MSALYSPVMPIIGIVFGIYFFYSISRDLYRLNFNWKTILWNEKWPVFLRILSLATLVGIIVNDVAAITDLNGVMTAVSINRNYDRLAIAIIVAIIRLVVPSFLFSTVQTTYHRYIQDKSKQQETQ